MRVMQPAKALVLTLTIAALLGRRCHADNLLGLWTTVTNRWSATGYTNRAERFRTVEFFKDHSFEITVVTVLDGKRWTNVPYTGTYTILGTNRVTLNVTFLEVPLRAKEHSRTVSCSLLGNELEIPKFITSVVPEYDRYRRVKR